MSKQSYEAWCAFGCGLATVHPTGICKECRTHPCCDCGKKFAMKFKSFGPVRCAKCERRRLKKMKTQEASL